MCFSCPPARHLCYACGSDHGPGVRNNVQTPVTGHLRVSHGSLSEVTLAVYRMILEWTPESTLWMREVSRLFRQNTDIFLQGYTEKVVRGCSRAYPSLRSLISRSLSTIRNSPDSLPYRVSLRFHMSVPPAIRSLGVSLTDCPNRILSPSEIARFGRRIEDENLQKVWHYLHQNRIPRAQHAFVPAVNAPAQVVRTWMHADGAIAQRFDGLILDDRQLTCIPKEIALFTALKALSFCNNPFVYVPEGLFRELSVLETISLCGNSQLVSVSEGLFQGLRALQSLFFAYNGLVSLPEGLFQGLTALQELYLHHNRLVSVPEGLFQGLTALLINFSCNQLVSVPEGLFHGLTALHSLDLDNNQLAFVPQGLFQGLSALEGLNLANNRLVSVPKRLFQGLTALQRLNLSNNQLVSVPQGLFQGLSALEGLNLANNQLASLPQGLFQGLTALLGLDLSGNQFFSLQEGLFQGLTALHWLELSVNQLVSLPEGLFQGLPALEELYLHDNPGLLVSYRDFSTDNHIEFLNEMREFFNYGCRSPLAQLYQLAARGSLLETVREAFSQLPATLQNAVFGKVWVEAGGPVTCDPQWGEHHAFEDMPRFCAALKRYVRERFEALSGDQQNAVYGHVYHLARNQRGADAVDDFNDPQWGETHAFDNILRLIDAMSQL